MTQLVRTATTTLLTIAAILAIGTVALPATQRDKDDPDAPSGVSAKVYLPAPPMQYQSWQPPDFPQAPLLTGVAASLYCLGFPDPRGCEYRTFEALRVDPGVGMLSQRGAMSVQKMEGWVLPLAAWKHRRVAIGWDGVIYRVETVGGNADLRAFVARVARKRAPDDRGRVLATCLLLRLGESSLAAKMLRSALDEDSRVPDYGVLASDWSNSLFEMGLSCHMQGRDSEAEAYLREWDLAADHLCERVAKGELPSYMFSDRQRRNVTRLIDDQARRRLEYGGRSRSLERVGRIRDRHARIDALIELLDEVGAQARVLDDPGYSDPSEDPIVMALVKEGLAAFPALLRAFKFDRRLTRTIGYWRFRGTLGEMLTASDAAAIALDSLLGEKGRAELDAYRAARHPMPEEWKGVTLEFLCEWWKRNAVATSK